MKNWKEMADHFSEFPLFVNQFELKIPSIIQTLVQTPYLLVVKYNTL